MNQPEVEALIHSLFCAVIAEHISQNETSLQRLVLDIEGVLADEMTVSCDNVITSYQIVSETPAPNHIRRQLDCDSILHEMVVFDDQIDYICDRDVKCTNFQNDDPRRIINADTLSNTKQRAFCRGYEVPAPAQDPPAQDPPPPQQPAAILCECDFPPDDDDLVLDVESIHQNFKIFSLDQ